MRKDERVPVRLPRRALLRLFAAVAAVTGAGAGVASASGDAQPAFPAPAQAAGRLRRWAMVIDLRHCDGCQSVGKAPQCTTACINGHFAPQPMEWIQVYEKPIGGGATQFILKGIAADELVRAIRGVIAGESYVSPKLAAHMLQEMRSPARAPLDGLSEREKDVLEGLAHGETNREIGIRLRLSEKTIKYYVTNVLIKLQVRNRVEAALLAQRASRES